MRKLIIGALSLIFFFIVTARTVESASVQAWKATSDNVSSQTTENVLSVTFSPSSGRFELESLGKIVIS